MLLINMNLRTLKNKNSFRDFYLKRELGKHKMRTTQLYKKSGESKLIMPNFTNELIYLNGIYHSNSFFLIFNIPT